MIAVDHLLSADAINRLQRYANTQSMDVCMYTIEQVRDLLRAALGGTGT